MPKNDPKYKSNSLTVLHPGNPGKHFQIMFCFKLCFTSKIYALLKAVIKELYKLSLQICTSIYAPEGYSLECKNEGTSRCHTSQLFKAFLGYCSNVFQIFFEREIGGGGRGGIWLNEHMLICPQYVLSLVLNMSLPKT